MEKIEKLRKKSIDIIKRIDSHDELEIVYSTLKRSEIIGLCNTVITQKLHKINNAMDIRLSDVLTNTGISFDEIESFLQTIITDGGTWDGRMLLNKTKSTFCLYPDDTPAHNTMCRAIARELKGSLGYGADQGPGEIMMILTGKYLNLAVKGDIQLNGKSIEVKATTTNHKTGSRSGGRMVSNSDGYGSVTDIRRELLGYLTSCGITCDTLDQFGWPDRSTRTQMGGLNLNLSGLSNLSNIFIDNKITRSQAQEYFEIMSRGLYSYVDDKSIQNLVTSVKQNSGFHSHTMLTKINMMAFDYYKQQAGFDRLVLFNVETGITYLMGHSRDLKHGIIENIVKFGSGVDWFDNRGKGSSQILV